MTDGKTQPQDDPAVAAELKGVPEELIGKEEEIALDSIDGTLAKLG